MNVPGSRGGGGDVVGGGGGILSGLLKTISIPDSILPTNSLVRVSLSATDQTGREYVASDNFFFPRS